MVKFRFNKNKIIPHQKDLINIFKISIASLISYFILSTPFNALFPQVEFYSLPIRIMILVSVSYYIKGLIDLKLNGRDYFWWIRKLLGLLYFS